ncbi:MAG: SdpI family protein [Candidatus Cloacimonetes bacterium]|nr:SdpI family protein [Candidatus Cloacimonadota bacterium]
MGRYLFSLIVIFIQLLFSLHTALGLPEQTRVPSHWNLQGEIDGYLDKWTGLLIFPALNLFLVGLMYFLPWISVRYHLAAARLDKVIPQITNILVFFFAVINFYIILIVRSIIPSSSNFILIILGLMFICLGNLFPKLPSTYFIGIRTPWSLHSEKIWRKTHKVGGYCFMISGFLMILIPMLFPENRELKTVLFILVMLIIFYPVLYSFLLYQQSKKQ